MHNVNHIHSCSYYCDRPECIKEQRDSLVKKLEDTLAQPEPVMFNGLTEAETNASASVMGLTRPKPEPVLYKWAALFEDPNNDWQAGYEHARRWVLEVGLQSIATPLQRKPLTEEEIENLGPLSFTWRDMVQFARAIEKAHGIGGEHE